MPPPNISRVVRLVLRDAARRLPELAHVRASQVLVVFGQARRASRASIRPLHFPETGTRKSASGRELKPVVRFRGRRILYVLTLRPLFFRKSSPEMRVETILHEALHMSPRFDGTLDPDHRHSVMGEAFYEQLRPLVQRYLEGMPRPLYEALALEGPVRVRMWLERPGRAYPVSRPRRPGVFYGRRMYTEEQTFLTTVDMHTPAPVRVSRVQRPPTVH